MFAVGEFVIYGINGVYSVTEIRSSPIDKNDTRSFYALKPLRGGDGSKAFVPVESDAVYLRPVMTREDAERFVGEELPRAEILTVTNERERKNLYRSAIGDHTPLSCARIIRTVAHRRRQLAGTSRRLPDTDAEYEREAKNNLFGELSVSLGIPFEEVEEYILERHGMAW